MPDFIEVLSAEALTFAGKKYRCAIGKGGIRADKKEGDGATPQGIFALEKILYRADRVALPKSLIPVQSLTPNDGWCDDPASPQYNQAIALPSPWHHEKLWREDEIYNIIVTLDHNTNPAIPGKGSAIFLHIAKPDYTPTDGCVALAEEDLREILGKISLNGKIRIP